MPRLALRNFPGAVALTVSSSGVVTAADAASLKPASIAVETWVVPTLWQVSPSYNPILTKSTGGAWGDGYGLYFKNDRSIQWWVNAYSGGAGGGSVSLLNAVTSPYRWMHLVGTYDGANVRLYLNGVQQGVTAYSTAFTHSTDLLRVGNHAGAGNAPDANIAGVRIWGRALSAQEVSDRYFLGRDDASMRTNLALQWDFSEQAGTSTADGSGSGNVGT